MNVKPMLGDWEIPRIASINTLERRAFVEMPVPGRVGSLFQDLNTTPTRIAISGSLYGDEARNAFLEEVRGKFREGLPVTFVADIVTATEVQYVIIETLRFQESGIRPDQIDYFMVLQESPPPPPPPDPLGGLDTGLLDQAGDFLDTITGALDVIDGLGSIPDIGDPTPPLTTALQGITEATSGLEDALGPLRSIFGTG
jgi:hypothetical protein